MLNSVDEVVQALGGLPGTAAVAGVSTPAVSNWKKRGRISKSSAVLINGALAALGKEAAPSVFGFKEIADEARA